MKIGNTIIQNIYRNISIPRAIAEEVRSAKDITRDQPPQFKTTANIALTPRNYLCKLLRDLIIDSELFEQTYKSRSSEHTPLLNYLLSGSAPVIVILYDYYLNVGVDKNKPTLKYCMREFSIENRLVCNLSQPTQSYPNIELPLTREIYGSILDILKDPFKYILKDGTGAIVDTYYIRERQPGVILEHESFVGFEKIYIPRV